MSRHCNIMASCGICLSMHALVVCLLALPTSSRDLVTDTSGLQNPQAMCKPTSVGDVSQNKDEDAMPAPAFVKIGRKLFPVLSSDGGRAKSDQQMCDGMWKILGRFGGGGGVGKKWGFCKKWAFLFGKN